MKKILFASIGLIVVLAAAVLIVPSFIDWNAYKDDIAALVKRATGRDLLIAGDIDINVLPAPALVARDVRLANLPGATASDMVRLKSMQVRIALLPLLGGSVQVQTIRLIEPVIEIEVFADGHSNLSFTAAGKEAPGVGALASGAPAGAPLANAPTPGASFPAAVKLRLLCPSAKTSISITGSISRMVCTCTDPPSSGSSAMRTCMLFSRTMSDAVAPGRLARRTSRATRAGAGNTLMSMSPAISRSRPVARLTSAAMSSL